MKTERKIQVISIGFFAATFLLSLVYPQLTDSAVHIIYSHFIFESGTLPFTEFALNAGKAFIVPPLFHILAAVSRTILGYYTIVPAFMGAASILLTYKFISTWYDEDTGFLAAMGLALNPFFFAWSLRMYIGTAITAGFLMTMYLYSLYRKKDERKYLYGSFLVGGSLAAIKTYGPLAAGIVLFHLLWENRKELKTTAGNVALPLLLGIVASFPWPMRNFLRTGSPIPKVIGRPFTIPSTSATQRGIWRIIPTLNEVQFFFAQALGIIPMSLVNDLGTIHPILPTLWYLLPLTLLGLLTYGAREEKRNTLIWIWLGAFIILYLVQRYLSHGVTGFKFRHFITFTPIIGLFAARAYQKLPVKPILKKSSFLLLVILLFGQMLGAATIRIQFANTEWGEITEWTQTNVPENDIIYSANARNLAYQLDHEYKVIRQSSKPGYIDPGGNFSQELQQNADWVIISDWENHARQRTMVERAAKQGFLEHRKTIESYRSMAYGEIGRTWYVYKVIKD